MGVVVSKEDDKQMKIRSKLIDDQLKQDQRKESDVIKLLLLGTAECGKSTVLKQMKILHGIGFNENEVYLQRITIYTNIISAMYDILMAMRQFSIPFDDIEKESNASVIFEAKKCQPKLTDGFPLSLTSAIKKLWADNGVQKCYLRGSEYQLYDSAKYFFDNVDRISEKSYVPNEQDILRTRISTTGITEVEFNMKNALVRIHESLMLFKTISNSPFFDKSAMILFLNKMDIFQEKIKTFPLTIAFPDYKGRQTYEEAATYIQSKFEKVGPQDKRPYVHRTCATDTKAIEFVFESCFNIVVEANLKSCGV